MQPMPYDFVIRGGRVIDPARGIDRVEDVYIRHSKIAPPPEGPCEIAEEIDAAGCLVLPGLIDFHTHLHWRHSDVGLHPDLYTLPMGITAAVDAGSAGTCNYEGMVHSTIAGAMITVKSFLNVTATGIITEVYFENLDPERFDVHRMDYLFERYSDEILGLKVRVGKRFSGPLGLAPLAGARKLGDRYGCPICCHIVWPEQDLDEAMPYFKPGDILCHCYQNQGDYHILDPHGRIRRSVREARERGVLFDCASGRKNHSLELTRQALAEGFFPDIISTDVITESIYRKSLFGLPRTMSEYLAMGMPLSEVIRAVTATPARLMRMEGEIGTLAPGALADIAVMRLREGPTVFEDLVGGRIEGEQLFIPQVTFKAGRLAFMQIDFLF